MNDKNTDTGSVPVSIAGLSESGVNAGLQEGDSLQQP